MKIRIGITELRSVSRPPPDVIVLDVCKIPEIVEEVSVVSVLLGSRVVAQVVVGARVVEGAALDHVKVARSENLVVSVVAHPFVALLAARVVAVFASVV